jgi:hypothetical protein
MEQAAIILSEVHCIHGEMAVRQPEFGTTSVSPSISEYNKGQYGSDIARIGRQGVHCLRAIAIYITRAYDMRV